MEPLVEYVERVDVWAATIEDKPGGLARVLAELREEGADLQFIISRRAEPGKGVVFVTPLVGDREIAAAAQVGFNVALTLHSVRVMGQDRPGVAAEVTQKLARLSASTYELGARRSVYWWSSHAVVQCLLETLSEPFQPILPKSWYF